MLDAALLGEVTRVHSLAFAEQRAFVSDRSLRVAALCTRRAGKSEGVGMRLLLAALTRPRSECLYVALTRGTAKEIMWDKLKDICRRAKVGYVERISELRICVGNNSSIRLVGLDANENMAAKVLGPGYREVAFDEAASYRTDLRALIRTFIAPAVTPDTPVTVTLAGTPDPDEARGFFYDVTTGKDRGWSLHSWGAAQNPHVAERIAEEIDRIERDDPLYKTTDEYRCMYEGKWPEEARGAVYKYDRNVNLCDMPQAPIVCRVIAIDLGWSDASAIVELGWVRHDRALYVLHAESESGLLLDQVADRVRKVIDARKRSVEDDRPVMYRLVIDGANRQAVEQLRQRYGLDLQAAEKTEKAVHIRMMNTDIQTQRLMVVRGVAGPLIEEWTGADEEGRDIKGATPLVWDARARLRQRLVEDPRCKNHCLAAGTMVETAAGAVPIELVSRGMLVHTRGGLREVRLAGCTGDGELWRVETTGGRVVVGTSEHPVFAAGEWKPIERVRAGDEVVTWESTDEVRAWCSAASPSEGIQTPPDASCECTSLTASAGAYIAWCMSPRTAQSQQGCWSTTSTVTRSTTTSATSGWSQRPSTRRNITRRNVRRRQGFASTQFATALPHGTVQTLGADGTRSTRSKSPVMRASTDAHAPCAVERSSPSVEPRLSAEAYVTRGSVARADSTTSAASVCRAGLRSCATAIRSRFGAHDRVRLVTRTGVVAPVFNLSVAEHEEYFANGVLVHNCADSALYSWREARAYRETEAPRVMSADDEMLERFAKRRKRIEQERRKAS